MAARCVCSTGEDTVRVGDFVYFEGWRAARSSPFLIGQLLELSERNIGDVSAKVKRFYRRRDLPRALIDIVDRDEEHSLKIVGGASRGERSDSDALSEMTKLDCCLVRRLPKGSAELSAHEQFLLRQRELFASRRSDTMSAWRIRGRCTVLSVSEVDVPDDFLRREDVFFYSLTYDPPRRALFVTHKPGARVGREYQCVVPNEMNAAHCFVEDSECEDKENENIGTAGTARGEPLLFSERDCEMNAAAIADRDVLLYHPHHHLTDDDIDQFLLLARSAGVFAHLTDDRSLLRVPSLDMMAEATGRDVATQRSLTVLCRCGFDIRRAVKCLMGFPNAENGTALNFDSCVATRDQLEQWSTAEGNLFEEAFEKFGKDFDDLRHDIFPEKQMREIIDFYYAWKTTENYASLKKKKNMKKDNELQQVTIRFDRKRDPNLIGSSYSSGHCIKKASACESCHVTESSQWYAWGPTHLQLRLCAACWMLWRKYGGLRHFHINELYDLDGSGRAVEMSWNSVPTVANPDVVVSRGCSSMRER